MSILDQLYQTKLPIVDSLEEVREIIRESSNLVLQAEPGAGKTSLIPLALLDVIADDKKILVLEPRRLAARNAAERMANLLEESVGKSIGFRIRDESRVSAHTRIEVITEGILVRMLQNDADLPGVGLVVFDEFHERSLDADLGLALCLESQETLREDLKLIVMSATLESQPIVELLGQSNIITGQGRSFPVVVEYLPPRSGQDWASQLCNALRKFEGLHVTAARCPDVLVFLPGIAEIKKAKQLLECYLENDTRWKILTLYGDLPFSTQQQVMSSGSKRQRIILSTNIAETSVTIDGIGCVIDTGLVRQSQFDPNVGFDRLRTRKISQASAKQRSGRAGRLMSGHCYRLWSESESLRKQTEAEILRADLASFVLELTHWGINEPAQLKLIDMPKHGVFNQAISLLQSLDALDQHKKLTLHGKHLLSLTVHPRFGHMLLKAVDLGVVELGCLLVAMLEETDVLRTGRRDDHNPFNPDFMARVDWVFKNAQTSHSRGKLHSIYKRSRRLQKKLAPFIINTKKSVPLEQSKPWCAILLAMIFPDRVAQWRGNGYRLANGSGAQLSEPIWREDELLVIVELGGTLALPKIFQAINLPKEQLESYFEEKIISEEVVTWDEKTQSVRGSVQQKFGELVLGIKTLHKLPQKLVSQELIRGIRRKNISNLPWTPALRQWQSRVQILRQLKPWKDELPNVSDSHLSHTYQDWLLPYLDGVRKIEQMTSQMFNDAVRGHLSWSQRQSLDQLMPLKLRVASGSEISLDYTQGDKPVLAVKLQEMFGVKQTPCVAGGKIPVIVHLLSPAKRSLQVTEDLASFWAGGYQEVKKEGRGRYPKHPWPDDPLTAQATKFTKNRTSK